MAHTGQEVLFCHIGLFRFFPRRVHLRVHPLQLGYLVSEQLQVPQEYVEEHGDHREGGGVDDGEPALSHAGDGIIQPLKGKNRHQIPLAVREICAVNMVARSAGLHNGGVIFTGIHGGFHLFRTELRLHILPFKDADEPVKIVLLGAALVSDNVAAVCSDHKGVAQRLVRVQKQHLAHILGGESHQDRKAAAAAGHGIFAGNAEQDHAVSAAGGGGGRFALPVSQALQKGLRVVERHRVAENHLDPAVGRIQSGAQKMPRRRAVFDLLPRSVTGRLIPHRNAGDGLRHGQAELDDRLEVQRHLLVHPRHIGGADRLDRIFAHIVNGDPKEGKHENRETNNHRDTVF